MNIDLDSNNSFFAQKARGRIGVKNTIDKATKGLIGAAKLANASGESLEEIAKIPIDFSSIFLGIRDYLNQEDFFIQEEKAPRSSYLNGAAAFYASTAMLNKVNTAEVVEARTIDTHSYQRPLSTEQIKSSSEFNFLEDIIKDTSRIPRSETSTLLKKGLFNYFEGIRDGTGSFLLNHASEKGVVSIEQLKITKEGYKFSNPVEPKRTKEKTTEGPSNVSTSNNEEDSVKGLTPYKVESNVGIDGVIGSEDAKIRLRAGMIRTLMFNSETNKNIMKEIGGNFKSCYILHGPPGVGKNLLVDSLINNFAQYTNISFEACNYTAGTKTEYRQKGGRLFEEYEKLQDKVGGIYVNVLDELDGVAGLDSDGKSNESSDAMIQGLKQSIDRNFLGNKIYFIMTNYPEKLESALKNKSHLVHVPGPENPEHMAQSFMRELGPLSKNLSEADFKKIGEHAYARRMELRPQVENEYVGIMKRVIATWEFRDNKTVCEPFVSLNPERLVENEFKLMTGTDAQRRNILLSMIEYPSVNDILKGIDHLYDQKQKQGLGETAAYNQA